MESDPSLLSNIKRSLKNYVQIAPGELTGYGVAAIGQVVFVLLQTWFGGRIINDLVQVVSQHYTDTRRIAFDMGVLIASGISEQVCWALLTYFEKRAYHRWSRYNFFSFLKKTSQLSAGQFEDKTVMQDLNVLLQEGYAWKPINFAQELLYLFHAGLRMLSTFVILATLLPLLIPILLLASIPTLLVEKKAARVHWGIWAAKGDESQTFWSIAWLLQRRDSVLEIQPQGSREFLLGKADAAISSFFAAQFRAVKQFLSQVLATRVFEGLIVGAINIWLLLRVITTKGKFSIGQYSIYAGLVQQFQNSISTVYKSAVNVFDFNQFMTVYSRFMDNAPDLITPARAVKLDPDEPLTVEYKEVSFKYPGADSLVFAGLNLTIKPGDHIAIVGQNGAGKSTLIKLLLRFYDVTEGQILVNGHDIREIDLASLYEHVGVLFQTLNHYPLTLAENVSIGRSNKAVNQGLVSRALSLAGLSAFAKTLPYGEDTVLEPAFNKGVELSGGQWQKVALARAFYRDADLLVLDEPTSAVDATAEYEIFRQIHKTQADKTTIIVSHRFSTVRQAKRILVIEKGRIKEEGTHSQLMRQNGLYKEMFSKQAQGYR